MSTGSKFGGEGGEEQDTDTKTAQQPHEPTFVFKSENCANNGFGYLQNVYAHGQCGRTCQVELVALTWPLSNTWISSANRGKYARIMQLMCAQVSESLA
jgi:hypothetical protein